MLSTPTAEVSTIHFHEKDRVHRVSYEIYRAKLKDELTPSWKKT